MKNNIGKYGNNTNEQDEQFLINNGWIKEGDFIFYKESSEWCIDITTSEIEFFSLNQSMYFDDWSECMYLITV